LPDGLRGRLEIPARSPIGTEFAAGEVTGPLLVVHFMGSVLFVFALVLAFIRPRMAALGALAASLLCLPIYLYFVNPGFLSLDVSG